MRKIRRWSWTLALLVLLAGTASAQGPGPVAAPALSINLGGSDQGNVATAIQIVAMMTLLTLAPSILMLMTSFTRIVIVLGFVRSAISAKAQQQR